MTDTGMKKNQCYSVGYISESAFHGTEVRNQEDFWCAAPLYLFLHQPNKFN